MKTLQKETIYVEAVSNKPNPKYKQAGGIKTADGWINVTEGQDLANVHKGDNIEVEVSVSEKGIRRIEKILGLSGTSATASTVSAPVVKTAAPKAAPASAQSYAERDQSMLIGGLFHDAATLVAINSEGLNDEEILTKFETFVVRLKEIREKVK